MGVACCDLARASPLRTQDIYECVERVICRTQPDRAPSLLAPTVRATHNEVTTENGRQSPTKNHSCQSHIGTGALDKEFHRSHSKLRL